MAKQRVHIWVLAVALLTGVSVTTTNAPAEAATSTTSGSVSLALRQYNTWRLKTTSSDVTFSGTASDIIWSGTWGWGNNRWRMGLRNSSGTQVSAIQWGNPKVPSGRFVGTGGTGCSFAVNTRVSYAISWPASDAYATFSGTFTY